MPDKSRIKIPLWTVIAAVCLLLFRQLLTIALPFALGALLALAAEPTVRLAERRLRLPRWAAAGIGVSTVFLLLLALLGLLCALLVRQLGRLSALLPQLANSVSAGLAALEQWLSDLAERLPASMQHNAKDSVGQLFSDSSAMLEQVVSRVPQAATGLMGVLSQWAFVILTAIISGYMLSTRLPAIRQHLKNTLPKAWRERYLPALRGLRKAVGGWLSAQGKLMGITFLLLSGGFLLLKTDNALLLSALVTLVDAFPVLGTGTVLIPWSIVCLLQGQTARGVGLLGLYSVVWLVRSVLEPRLVGKELGLDPLVTLFSVYAGFCLLGLGGMLIAPFVAMLVTQLLKHRVQ